MQNKKFFIAPFLLMTLGVANSFAETPTLIKVPESSNWQERGIIVFLVKFSRDLFKNPDLKMEPLVKSSLFDVDLGEGGAHPFMDVRFFPKNRENKPSRFFFSRLNGEQWYCFAFSWDKKSGFVKTYLNGNIQNEAKVKDWPEKALSDKFEIGLSKEFSCSVKDAVFFEKCMNENELKDIVRNKSIKPLKGEGVTDYEGKLDLSPYKKELVYEADFSRPLNTIEEEKLFKNGKRNKLPEGKEWVFEGVGRAWTEGGKLLLEKAENPPAKHHLVLWNTHKFPENFLLEFCFEPENPKKGLAIVFFSSTSPEGGSIFEKGLPERSGVFSNYINGAIDSYHISYFACRKGPRYSANLRKNSGFHLVSCGKDRVYGHKGSNSIRILKFKNRIMLEENGRLSLVFSDDGKTYGPVNCKSGYIGLRQMNDTGKAAYSSFKVWKLKKKQQ